MKIKDMTKEELELLSYTDLTYMLLNENKKSMSTPNLFKCICELLEYSDEDYTNKISDYYTSLTIDKRFILLDNAEWDLTKRHSVNLIIDDEEEESDEDNNEEKDDDIEEEIIDDEENIDSTVNDEDIIDDDDDIDDLTILSEDEIETSE